MTRTTPDGRSEGVLDALDSAAVSRPRPDADSCSTERTVTNVYATRRHRIAAAVAALAVPLLSSCSVGFDAQTNQVYTPGKGTNNRDSQVDVLHALVVSGSEGSGTLIAALVNNEQLDDDALVGVSGAGEDADLEITVPGETEIPAAELVQLADEDPIAVSGEAVVPGAFLTVTFTFENADAVTLDVPVVENTNEFADIELPEG